MRIRINHYVKQVVLLVVLITAIMPLKPAKASGFTYHWGHPSPQGNIVYNMVFADEATGWAVTGCGLILKTINGGESWELTREPDSLCSDLFDILITSQGTLLASGDHGMIIRSTDEGLNWQKVIFPDAGRLYDLALIPGGGVSAAGENGQVLVSYDDGISWINKGPGGTGYARHHFWKTDLEGYVVGFGMFYRTVDGGNSWVQAGTPSFFGMNEVYFVNNNVGYAVEDFGYFKTLDGGNTWTHVAVFSGIAYRFRTSVIDEMHWFSVAFGEGGELWETTDAGATWVLKSDYYSTGFLCLVKNGSRLLFGSDIGDIFYTDDGGTTRQDAVENLAVFPSAPITIIGKRPDGKLFANNQPNTGVNNGTFYRSDDGGLTWYLPALSPGLRWVYDIKFSDDQHGVLGSYSDIRYTNDGGDTWNESSLPADYRLVNFALPAQNLYFAGTYTTSPTGGGNIYRSTDQGATWQVVGGGLPVNFLYVSCIAFADANTGYVACLLNTNLPGIYKTTDSGNSWTLISQSGLSGYISDMTWLDENTGIAVAPNSGSGIFRTTDGGLHWIKVSEAGARHLTGISGNRMAAVDPGDAIFQESTDGGLSWLSYSPPFSSVNAGFQGSVQSIQITGKGYILGGTGNRLMVADRIVNTGTEENHGLATAGKTQQIITVTPNPVVDRAVIRFNMSASGHVTLALYNAQGRLVYSFMEQLLQPGIHEVPFDAGELRKSLGAGIYLVSLQSGKDFDSVKVVLAE
jgi:photosystem II stability/assembly factor-like uncharacterized protein